MQTHKKRGEDRMAKTALLSFAVVALGVFCRPAFSHHSYSDYKLDERYEFTGTVAAVRWGNPHILFDVRNADELMHVEWVTTAGADKTGVNAQQIEVGDQLTIIGSRHRDQSWQWVSPSVTRTRQ
jgi:hypothetical protein